MIKGVDNALNLAVFVMWVVAILNLFVMFVSDAELLKSPAKHLIYRWFVRLFSLATVFHSVYWGYFFAPSIWFIAVIVLWVRKYELDNRKRI